VPWTAQSPDQILTSCAASPGATIARLAKPGSTSVMLGGGRARVRSPVEGIDYFQARDKYTSVVAADAEYVIRTPIRELAAQIDPEQFWQVHRGTIVNIARVVAVERKFGGRLLLRLRGRDQTVRVSRAYAHRFEQM
jgi:DNA-binding LytR/AlgR family response regulator